MVSLSKTSCSFGKAAYTEKVHYKLAEAAGVYAVFHGISAWSPPAAWIILGLAAIVAIEVRS